MDFSLSEEQELLQSTVRSFVERECDPRTAHAVFDGERTAVASLWAGLVDMGLPGLSLPEAHGGSGRELLDLALVAEELGRGAVPAPFLGHALAALVLARHGSEAQQATWSPGLASGGVRATVALAETGGRWLPGEWGAELEDGRVTGRKTFVPEADGADLFVVGCRGGGLALVEGGSSVRVEEGSTLDRGRPLYSVAFEAAPAEVVEGAAAVTLIDAASTLLAADAFGAAHRLIRATAAYLQTREQFGRPLATFQGLKHQLANMVAELDPSRGLWWYAGHAFDHAPAEASRAAALAKAHITERAQQVARDCVEAHGGIGFTWECDVQIWFKRVMFDRLWLGAPDAHRERYAALEGW